MKTNKLLVEQNFNTKNRNTWIYKLRHRLNAHDTDAYANDIRERCCPQLFDAIKQTQQAKLKLKTVIAKRTLWIYITTLHVQFHSCGHNYQTCQSICYFSDCVHKVKKFGLKNKIDFTSKTVDLCKFSNKIMIVVETAELERQIVIERAMAMNLNELVFNEPLRICMEMMEFILFDFNKHQLIPQSDRRNLNGRMGKWEKVYRNINELMTLQVPTSFIALWNVKKALRLVVIMQIFKILFI